MLSIILHTQEVYSQLYKSAWQGFCFPKSNDIEIRLNSNNDGDCQNKTKKSLNDDNWG